MKKTPFLLKNSNAASQSVPNKKPITSTNLNYLQILKQYNSCKLIKTEVSSLQPASRLKVSKDLSPSPAPNLLNLKPKLNININNSSTKNLLKSNIPLLNNNQIDEKTEKIGSPPNPTKLLNKYMVKVPFDSYLRSSRSKENEENKQIYADKSEKENVYYIGDRNFTKRNSKIPSNGSDRGSLGKEKTRLSPKEHPQKDSAHNFEVHICVFHPDKRVIYFFIHLYIIYTTQISFSSKYIYNK